MSKIALISEHASPIAPPGGVDSGGQNIYVANVARQLVELGHAVDVFTRRDNALTPQVLCAPGGYSVVHVPAGPPRPVPKEALLPHMEEFGTWLTRYLGHAARAGAPYDIVHANFFMSGMAGLAIKRALGTPLVITFHALGRVRRIHQREADGFPDARFDIEDMLVREADRIVAECPQDRSDLIRLYRANPLAIETVPCGFDAGEFFPLDRDEARANLRWAPRAFIVLQLGRLVPRKGIDNVIRSIGRLARQTQRQVRLYVVGGNTDAPDERATPEIGRLRKIARDAGVEEHVVFVGRRDREVLRLCYAACDVFVTTPWYEPFGITPVEAMACARPVVGAAVGGIRSTVVDGATGYLVPPDNPEALAARLGSLMEHEGKAHAMGRAGQARAARLYTWRGVATRLATVYERTLRRLPPTEFPGFAALPVHSRHSEALSGMSR